MLFSSIPFLYYFLPAVFILYFIAPNKLKNAVLLLSSLVFYAWGEPKYVFLMLASIISGYIFGLLIEKFRQSPKKARLFLGISVGISLALLIYFKYADFFIGNFNAATGLSLPLLRLALPVGISFYTFQLISYAADVYRGLPAQRNPVSFGAYIAMFPQLIAGPIVRYSDIAGELAVRRHSFDLCCEGASRFVLGLCKKILLSDRFAELCAAFRASGEKSVLFYWLYAVSFTLQIYFDFSGYSDMAIGLGRMLGFEFLENFNYPYISKSVTEFWRRWHMSLGTWFRDYLYIPLGGNRRGLPRQILNILIVWALTGLWHGANWTFLLWGLYYAVFLILEKVFLLKKLEKVPVLAHIYALLVAVVGWMLFQLNSVGEVAHYWGAMFGASGAAATAADAFYAQSYAVILFIAAIAATPVPKKLFQRIPQRVQNVLTPVLVALCLVISTAYLVDATYNPFLYFRF